MTCGRRWTCQVTLASLTGAPNRKSAATWKLSLSPSWPCRTGLVTFTSNETLRNSSTWKVSRKF